MDTSERSALARAMAKAIAYRDCGKQEQAEAWARELCRLLGCAGVLRDEESHEPSMSEHTHTAECCDAYGYYVCAAHEPSMSEPQDASRGVWGCYSPKESGRA